MSKGGHPSDIENLQLAHFSCNRRKSDKLIEGVPEQKSPDMDNRNLPLSMNWALYSEVNQGQLREEVVRIEATGRHLYADGIR